jgi:putative tricarboxylic transport membrane protein
MSAFAKASLGAAAACLTLAACGSGGGSTSAEGEPTNTEVVTHNEVGGGSDVFTRQIIKILADNDIIDSQWPVKNIPAGDSIGAMSYMIGRDADPNVIAQMTPTWIATPMTVEDAGVSVDQLTPLAMLAEEPQVVAARADSPYDSLADFIEDAEASPGTLVQSGGSSTANDALTKLVLEDTTGAEWKFLSFEDTGARITALLRGDADISMGSAEDFAEQERAGDLKIISVIGDEPLDIFPDAGTTEEQGVDTTGVPVQFRAIVGAPNMPEDAVQYYQDAFSDMVKTDDWETTADESGLNTDYRPGDEFESYLTEQTTLIGDLLEDLGLRKDQ